MMSLFNTPEVRGQLLFDEPMSHYNTWQVGGNAECLFKPADLDDLSQFIASIDKNVDITWLGLGSNVLIRDGGLAGVVIITQGCLNNFVLLENNTVMADAGVACAKLARQTNKKGLSGLEFMAGIPGTVGGALAMNAGAHGESTWNKVIKVDVINRQGEVITKTADQFDFGYRQLHMPDDEWFVSAYFKLDPIVDNDNVISIKELMQRRSDSQPIGKKNCGSVFMNPPGNYAAKLIEECGLKGYSIGGACVSEKHANFIINENNASADDIEQLIKTIIECVENKFKLKLQTEVKVLGRGKS
jgi:UDP-N-acetylmuramate dehydrogenase